MQVPARGPGPGIGHPARVDRLLHRGHHQLLAQSGPAPVAVRQDFAEAVAGVHVQDREGEAPRAEGLLCQPQEHGRSRAPVEQQHGPLALGDHLPQDEDGVGLEEVQVAGPDGAPGGGPGGVAAARRRSDEGGHGRSLGSPGRAGDRVAQKGENPI